MEGQVEFADHGRRGEELEDDFAVADFREIRVEIGFFPFQDDGKGIVDDFREPEFAGINLRLEAERRGFPVRLFRRFARQVREMEVPPLWGEFDRALQIVPSQENLPRDDEASIRQVSGGIAVEGSIRQANGLLEPEGGPVDIALRDDAVEAVHVLLEEDVERREAKDRGHGRRPRARAGEDAGALRGGDVVEKILDPADLLFLDEQAVFVVPKLMKIGSRRRGRRFIVVPNPGGEDDAIPPVDLGGLPEGNDAGILGRDLIEGDFRRRSFAKAKIDR